MTTLGVSTGCYHGLNIVTEDAVDHVAALGVDVVEVYLQGTCELVPDVVNAIVQRLGRSSLRVLSVHPYVFGWENLLFGSYERQRRWAQGQFEAYLDVCVAVGAEAYVSHGPPAHHVVRPDGSLATHYIDITAELVARAARRGVRYCLENVSYGVLRTPDDLQRHRAAVPDLAFVVDFKSAWKAGSSPALLLAAAGASAQHTHASFRGTEGFGMPADQEGQQASDPDILSALSTPVPHILEIEARELSQVPASLAAMRSFLCPASGRTS